MYFVGVTKKEPVYILCCYVAGILAIGAIDIGTGAGKWMFPPKYVSLDNSSHMSSMTLTLVASSCFHSLLISRIWTIATEYALPEQ